MIRPKKWLLSLILLAGCESTPVFRKDVVKAEEVCKPHGGWYSIRGGNGVHCIDGTWKSLLR